MRRMKEQQWIHEIQKGRTEYLQEIAEAYYDDIYRFCVYQTGNREDAYDLAQETFLRFIRYAESYRNRNLKGYLLTIARNLSLDYLSKQGQDRMYNLEPGEQDLDWDKVSAESSVELQAEQKDSSRQLRGYLMELPQMQREAVILHYLQGRRYREIAQMTGASVSTVKSRVRQGIEKLEKIIGKEDF